jgi:hypothetical protein
MCAALVVALSVMAMKAATAEPVEFVALGDMPYSETDAEALQEIGHKIKERKFPFLILYGDIKSGSSACNPTDLQNHFDLIANAVDGPVFYTPGDNDWTDCDREKTGAPIAELEALGTLRRLFFSAEALERQKPFDPGWTVTRPDPDYPENALWTYGGLQFVTLHVVGTDNGRDAIGETDKTKMLDMVDARDRANLDVLKNAFDDATKNKRNAIVVVIHADPYDLEHKKRHETVCKTGDETTSMDARTKCNPYLPFVERLRTSAAAFGKPVLLIHGSTDDYCVDREFGTAAAPNLWRLNGPGDGKQDAAVIRFDSVGSKQFDIESLKSKTAVRDCDS